MAVANKSKAKGSRFEAAVKKILKDKTNLNWQRTPGSGALSEEHKMKGDLYIPQCACIYTIECKHYKDTHLNYTLLTGKNPMLLEWWSQSKRQALQNGNEPLLIFKHDRSAIFVMGEGIHSDEKHRCIYLSWEDVDILLLDDWLSTNPEFIK